MFVARSLRNSMKKIGYILIFFLLFSCSESEESSLAIISNSTDSSSSNSDLADSTNNSQSPVSANSAPTVIGSSFIMDQDTVESSSLSALDSDGDSLVYSIVTAASNGFVNITDSSTGTYTYTPTTNYTGSDSFTFKVNDGTIDSNPGTITVTISPYREIEVMSRYGTGTHINLLLDKANSKTYTRSYAGGSNLEINKFNYDGSVDTDFGTAGVLTITSAANNPLVNINSDGDLVLIKNTSAGEISKRSRLDLSLIHI